MGTREDDITSAESEAVRRTRGSTGTHRLRAGSSSWSGTSTLATERTPHDPPPVFLPASGDSAATLTPRVHDVQSHSGQ